MGKRYIKPLQVANILRGVDFSHFSYESFNKALREGKDIPYKLSSLTHYFRLNKSSHLLSTQVVLDTLKVNTKPLDSSVLNVFSWFKTLEEVPLNLHQLLYLFNKYCEYRIKTIRHLETSLYKHNVLSYAIKYNKTDKTVLKKHSYTCNLYLDNIIENKKGEYKKWVPIDDRCKINKEKIKEAWYLKEQVKTKRKEFKKPIEVFKKSLTPPTLQNDRIVFKPNLGPQTEFLAANEQDVLYGGAAGGGKSYAMLVDPLRYAHRPTHRALILRRSMPELRELIDKSRELYPQAFKGAKFREVDKIWKFPSKATIQFSFLEKDSDVYRFQGQAYTWIGFDEITHLPTEFPWNYLASRLRTTDPKIQTYMRATANPGGVGAHWVKKRYIEPEEPNKSFTGTDGIQRKFIPASLHDNPYLAHDGLYEKMLNSLPPTLRLQLLEGNWDVNEGAAFTEFDITKHVIPPFEIPAHWARYKGADYGYAAPSAVVWAAIDPSDNTLIIYKELYQKGLTGKALAQKITEMEVDEPTQPTGVLDWAAWNSTGTIGPTVGQELVMAGHKFRRADKNRIQGKLQIHEWLKINSLTNRPKMQFFNTCINTIKELQGLPLDKNKPEDVDTHAPDHAYDALRYLLMSRPRIRDTFADMNNLKQNIYNTPTDHVFGY